MTSVSLCDGSGQPCHKRRTARDRVNIDLLLGLLGSQAESCGMIIRRSAHNLPSTQAQVRVPLGPPLPRLGAKAVLLCAILLAISSTVLATKTNCGKAGTTAQCFGLTVSAGTRDTPSGCDAACAQLQALSNSDPLVYHHERRRRTYRVQCLMDCSFVGTGNGSTSLGTSLVITVIGIALALLLQ